MDESDPNESNDDTNNDIDGRNESDNKLTQYMLINKELSKTLVALKAENAKLRYNNKELNLENLNCRNELTSNQNEISKWRRKFSGLQTMHIQHIEMLTGELQSYADKLTGVFGHDENHDEDEVTRRITELHTNLNYPSISDDVSQRVSKSLEPRKTDIRLPDVLDENPSSLNTINEESEEDSVTSDSEQISLVTSTHESTLTAERRSTDAYGTKSTIDRSSLSDAHEMASMDSNKENERPSAFLNSDLSLTDEDSASTIRATESPVKAIKKSITPFKEKFITERRTRKRTVEQNSFESTNSPDLVSSTPYKRKRIATYSGTDIKYTTPERLNDSSRMTRRTTMSITASGRPKRNVRPVSLVEPKLNTKLRRPRYT